MSYTILKSIKAYKLTDGENEVYTLCMATKDNNTTGGYTKSLNGGTQSKEYLFKSTIGYFTNRIIDGSVQLYGSENMTKPQELKEFLNKVELTLEKPKTIQVEKLYTVDGKIEVKWGEGQEYLEKNEPKLYFTNKLSSSGGYHSYTDSQLNQVIDIIKTESNEPEKILPLLSENPGWERNLGSKPQLNEEQLATLLKDGNGDIRVDRLDTKITNQEVALSLVNKETNEGYNLRDIQSCLTTELQKDTKFNKKLIEVNPSMIGEVHYSIKDEIINDKQFLEGLTSNGKEYTSTQYQDVYEHSSKTLKSNPEFCKKLLEKDGWILNEAPAEIKDNKDCVISATTTRPSALEEASDRLKADFDTVMACVKLKGYAIKNAHEDLKNNKEIVYEAVKNDSESFRYAGSKIKEEIGNKDPQQYIESQFLADKLQNQLASKQNQSPTKKMKI